MTRKNYKRVIAPLLAVFLAGNLPLAVYAEQTEMENAQMENAGQKAKTEMPFSARVYGPGEENLSASDPYARYQWGLKNDGELQYVEIQNKFENSNPELAKRIDLANYLGIPAPVSGPDAYYQATITSVNVGAKKCHSRCD